MLTVTPKVIFQLLKVPDVLELMDYKCHTTRFLNTLTSFSFN